ncbi:hypothetical protein [Plantibacter sp. CFBP 8804]|uniref:hypothetical protein n=1 Tax=Plantibacter sp. CFBP 8804 TaxID=2775270 RepID=UPI0017823156|nr:hypothetical protein [Plantibacter sp. CFBP 8804]MBD8518865.1 hypothetical protein [Plantibacter sp. CFBP 8804]
MRSVLSVTEALYGRPIRVVLVDDLPTTRVTGLWVGTADVGLILVRRTDAEYYRLVSGLHEVAHVLLAHAPSEIIQEVFGFSPQRGPSHTSVTELCTGHLIEENPDDIESLVEDIALAIEGAARSSPPSSVEVHL